MRLPNSDRLRVDQDKVLGYLLNLSHRFGASKAQFFLGFGFEITRWHVLAEALRRHGSENEVTRSTITVFGPRYEVEGPLESPDRRNPQVRTIWQWDHGTVAPRLITAYPIEEVTV